MSSQTVDVSRDSNFNAASIPAKCKKYR